MGDQQPSRKRKVQRLSALQVIGRDCGGLLTDPTWSEEEDIVRALPKGKEIHK